MAKFVAFFLLKLAWHRTYFSTLDFFRSRKFHAFTVCAFVTDWNRTYRFPRGGAIVTFISAYSVFRTYLRWFRLFENSGYDVLWFFWYLSRFIARKCFMLRGCRTDFSNFVSFLPVPPPSQWQCVERERENLRTTTTGLVQNREMIVKLTLYIAVMFFFWEQSFRNTTPWKIFSLVVRIVSSDGVCVDSHTWMKPKSDGC